MPTCNPELPKDYDYSLTSTSHPGISVDVQTKIISGTYVEFKLDNSNSLYNMGEGIIQGQFHATTSDGVYTGSNDFEIELLCNEFSTVIDYSPPGKIELLYDDPTNP